MDTICIEQGENVVGFDQCDFLTLSSVEVTLRPRYVMLAIVAIVAQALY